MALTLSDVMSAIYECEENCSLSLSSDWHQGWRVTIGGSQHTNFVAEQWVDSPMQAAHWLHEQASERIPAYKHRYGDRVIGTPPGHPYA